MRKEGDAHYEGLKVKSGEQPRRSGCGELCSCTESRFFGALSASRHFYLQAMGSLLNMTLCLHHMIPPLCKLLPSAFIVTYKQKLGLFWGKRVRTQLVESEEVSAGKPRSALLRIWEKPEIWLKMRCVLKTLSAERSTGLPQTGAACSLLQMPCDQVRIFSCPRPPNVHHNFRSKMNGNKKLIEVLP